MAADGDRNPRFFVAVHVGAGYHSPSNEKAYRRAIKRACLAAAAVLRKDDGTCLDAVSAAIQVLEVIEAIMNDDEEGETEALRRSARILYEKEHLIPGDAMGSVRLNTKPGSTTSLNGYDYIRMADDCGYLLLDDAGRLMDDPITNAGRGSNLTEEGHVECDASIMDGCSGAYGAVGAVPDQVYGMLSKLLLI